MAQQAKIQTDRPSGGVSANGWNITLAWFSVFVLFCDHKFCSRPQTKPENRFLRGFIHRMSIPGYWFPRGIKLQKIYDFPNFYPKNAPKWAWIGILKLNAHNIKTCILSKLLNRFKPNFAQWQRPPKYTSWVIQTGVQQIQDGGRPPSWKIKNGRISTTVRPICTKFGMMTHFGPPKGMGR